MSFLAKITLGVGGFLFLALIVFVAIFIYDINKGAH